jgi:phosphatidylglycerol---prolipoprotein diacylglyceryl transferase
MFPILFRIPLPHMPLKLWWAMAAIAALSALYSGWLWTKDEKSSAKVGFGIAAAAGIAGYVWRAKAYEAVNLPIYSYGVMLGLSLVVGWYLTLGLAERDGLPKETMANCYVVTAIVALLGSRILYVATNLDQFKTLADMVNVRKGGYVAYGGFLGGFLGSWAYLRSQKLKLLPWADVAVPSLASGLLITRIGCYLFGCDFGKRLPEDAPTWLKKIGTFPQWQGALHDAGDGSPAFVRHRELFRSTTLGSNVMDAHASLPVHPTQIYESLVGLALLGLILWQRKTKKFSGQMFYLFVFAYGVIRFGLEMLRDDEERGEWGPVMAQHILFPICMVLFAIAFAFGVSLGIKDMRSRTIARVLGFLPAVLLYLKLAPGKFGQEVAGQLSTSQFIALITGLLAAYFYASAWVESERTPPVKKKKKKRPEPTEVAETDETESTGEASDASPEQA